MLGQQGTAPTHQILVWHHSILPIAPLCGISIQTTAVGNIMNPSNNGASRRHKRATPTSPHAPAAAAAPAAVTTSRHAGTRVGRGTHVAGQIRNHGSPAAADPVAAVARSEHADSMQPAPKRVRTDRAAQSENLKTSLQDNTNHVVSVARGKCGGAECGGSSVCARVLVWYTRVLAGCQWVHSYAPRSRACEEWCRTAQDANVQPGRTHPLSRVMWCHIDAICSWRAGHSCCAALRARGGAQGRRLGAVHQGVSGC